MGRRVARLLPSPPPRVLDVGAGTGFLAILLARNGYLVSALDLSEGMLGRLKAKADDAGLEVQTIHADATETPLDRFDAVQVAGEIADFDEDRYTTPKDKPHVARVAPLALAAVEESLADSGLEPERMSRDELRGIAVILGSGGGTQEFTERQYDLYYSGHEKQCSVYVIPVSTIGTLASEDRAAHAHNLGPSYVRALNASKIGLSITHIRVDDQPSSKFDIWHCVGWHMECQVAIEFATAAGEAPNVSREADIAIDRGIGVDPDDPKASVFGKVATFPDVEVR